MNLYGGEPNPTSQRSRPDSVSEVVTGRKNLIIGRKGSGKSAICMRLSTGDLNSGETCLITPDDAAGEELRRFVLGGLTGPAAKALLWRYVFAVHAARFLVRHASGDDHRRRRPSSMGTLERFLRDNGELAEENLYHRVARAGRGLMSSFSLEAFGVKVAVDANNAPQGVRASRQLEIVESGVRKAFADLGCTEEHGSLLVMVDQLEQVWSGESESEALVIGLLLAGKHTALTYGKSLRCVLFLRSDIYDALDFSDADKFHSDEIRINWTARQLHQLAMIRAGVALGRRLDPHELWGEVFPATVITWWSSVRGSGQVCAERATAAEEDVGIVRTTARECVPTESHSPGDSTWATGHCG
ncbi:P-loop ATPase, Sll1717 family [Saccharothrix deserti]|uniref:P-loop ATPase, Sll1717 family n=1 Tax=Saccharothrix deserti TaxID=2593674 RepID=UPI003B75BBE1